MQPIQNRYIPLNRMSPSSSYQSTMARFNHILNDKLGVPSPTVGVMSQPSMATQRTSTVELLSPTERASIAVDPTIDVRMNSGNSAKKIDDMLAGTPIQGLGNAFKRAELKTGVNAYVLAGMAIHESNYGKSSIAQNKRNLFGFMAYDNNPYANARAYASFEDSINDVANYLSKEYLREDGQYFKGTGLADIGQNYASDPMWASKVAKHVEELIK